MIIYVLVLCSFAVATAEFVLVGPLLQIATDLCVTPYRGNGRLTHPGGLAAMAVTLLALTGFVATFAYVEPMLQTVTGLIPGLVSVGLVGYRLGTAAGNLLPGKVRPATIARQLPGALGAALGGAVLSAGLGLAWIAPVAAVPVLAATAVAASLGQRRTPAVADLVTP